jgi:hypothetical protein
MDRTFTLEDDPSDGDQPFPWPPVEGAGVLAAAAETWQASLLQPAVFFRRVPRSDGTGPAILYYLGLGILAAGATLFWRGLGVKGSSLDAFTDATVGRVPAVADFLLSPVYLLLALALASLAVHVVLAIAGGARHGPGTTARTLCYAYGPVLFTAVPVIGGPVAVAWMITIAVIGLREAHGTETWRAALAILLPATAAILLATLFVLLALAGRFLLEPLL